MFAALAASATPVFAAEFRVAADSQTLDKGAVFEVRVLIDSQGESINAFGGTVTFPGNLLTPLEVREGGSMVNFWVEQPSVATSSTVRFSGITAGGFMGRGLLFSIIFRSTRSGNGTILVTAPKALRNDGAGTPVHTTSVGAHITISNTMASSANIPEVADTDPPERFTPAVAHDPTLFGDKYFLVFATQDKRSGIDHYEVCEGNMRECTVAASPYLLEHQDLEREIFVTAIDRAGNERIGMLPAPVHLPLYQGLLLLAILGILVYALINWRRIL